MFTQSVIDAVRQHAEESAPREACGMVVEINGAQHYMRCSNVSDKPDQFMIHPDEAAAIEDCHTVVGIAHSHYASPPTPSAADLAGCESSGLPWLIVNYPVGNYNVVKPSGFVAPLENRQYHYGVFDCYTIIRDYYLRNFDIRFPDFPYEHEWWLKGQDLYTKNFGEAGFVEVGLDRLRKHDVLLMKCMSPVVNHAAIYVGDTKIMHHTLGRLSGVETYGGYWRKVTVTAVRHRELYENN